MSFNGSLPDEILLWLDEEGRDAVSEGGVPYKKIGKEVRVGKLVMLLTRLKEMGAEYDYFTNANCLEIAESCIPYQQSIGVREWKKQRLYVLKDIHKARVKVYGPSGRENDPIQRGREEIEGEKLTVEDAALVVRTERKPVEVRKSKEFDRSKVKDREPSRDVVDPELEDLLGNK